ncbi:uncharacterized protein STEHIDRAFT_158860 [Stereum hirsutum FP-91666 SS1]|uniref:uncharacterized protein n=1 Tax=Stereum hirsutum (strain FP-91666) TaxID=721885 RepID=UPI0004449432|nr:uncharacterized protein STEHIDRAFT_158860 [Stereum hirsutum FP-91666 SS1]EIM85171.1 hypothetical protein STEHIDRAFT_158860 [Stereum hirsutum FP-91666 SS1]
MAPAIAHETPAVHPTRNPTLLTWPELGRSMPATSRLQFTAIPLHPPSYAVPETMQPTTPTPAMSTSAPRQRLYAAKSVYTKGPSRKSAAEPPKPVVHTFTGI